MAIIRSKLKLYAYFYFQMWYMFCLEYVIIWYRVKSLAKRKPKHHEKVLYEAKKDGDDAGEHKKGPGSSRKERSKTETLKPEGALSQRQV